MYGKRKGSDRMMASGKKILLTGLLLIGPAAVFAGEECSMVGGICRDACGTDEEAEVGAFLDCTDKQECCVKKTAQPDSPGKTLRDDLRNGGKREAPSGQGMK
jgi:hypothetical protein